MQNVMAIWSGLSMQRRLVVAAATIGVFLAVLGLSRLAGSPGMDLLYAGLDARAAGDVVTALDARGVTYEVRGDSIWVDATQRDSLRMALAGEGLPAAGGSGYELLDQLTGFGTTAQMFDAAYWRAKEGELARTLLAMPDLRTARVHIAQGPSDGFRRDTPPSASVTVTSASGRLTDSQAQAIRHLVASAVAGMTVDAVQVIDAVGGLIPVPSDPGASGSDAAAVRAAAIRANVERLLEARVGPGRAVVEVSLDLITDRETVTERTFDPQGRVQISSETEERSTQSTEPGGDVTVASNLPEGDAGAGAGGQAQSSETRERVNFEVSETQRELTRGPGGIKRQTIAVLLDGQTVTAADGTTTWEPRSDEELAALRDLVASATGFDEARGDVLTLKSLEFTLPPVQGTEATTSLLPPLGPINVMTAIQVGVLALVALILGLFVLRPVLMSARAPAALPPPEEPLALPGIATGGLNGGLNGGLTGEIDQGFSMGDLPMVDFATEAAAIAEDPAARLRRLIEERQVESLEILRGWMEPEEERA